MILSVSRRTDVPAFYGEWFLNRLKEGFVCVRNPMNGRQISRVELTPGRIEAIVFWTKNPAESFLEKLSIMEERGYRFYFQFTLTPYGADIEPGLPPLNGSNGSPCSRRKSCRLRSRPPAYPVKRPARRRDRSARKKGQTARHGRQRPFSDACPTAADRD